jgi:hypothetical protein
VSCWMAWHNECGAIRFGRVVRVAPGRVYTSTGEAVLNRDQVACAPTVETLEEQVCKHRKACHVCALAEEAMQVLVRRSIS